MGPQGGTSWICLGQVCFRWHGAEPPASGLGSGEAAGCSEGCGLQSYGLRPLLDSRDTGQALGSPSFKASKIKKIKKL